MTTRLNTRGSGTRVPSKWNARYGQRHALERITAFPNGILPPRRVRLYARNGHYVLQWWDPKEKATLSDRVDGDLLAALMKARQIDERLAEFKASGQTRHKRLTHDELVQRFLTDLDVRALAGEIDSKTVARYRSALAHYQEFCHQASILKSHPHVSSVDRSFRLAFEGFLAQRRVTRNGSAAGEARVMRAGDFVRDTVRAMLCWASDPDRGALLPEGFRNPFLGTCSRGPLLYGDPLAPPDISTEMAVTLVGACDSHQLRLFVPMLLFGLRAAEPCWLFAEHLDAEWLRVPCIPELGVLTKGRRDKRFPLLEELGPFWSSLRPPKEQGLIYRRRDVDTREQPNSLVGVSLDRLIEESNRRREASGSPSAELRAHSRRQLLRDAGGIDYDHVRREFVTVTHGLDWPRSATLKDLRHLFATAMNNASMPDSYRKYLMGHAPGRSAMVAYTHLNELRRHYTQAVRAELGPVIEAVSRRHAELNDVDKD